MYRMATTPYTYLGARAGLIHANSDVLVSRPELCVNVVAQLIAQLLDFLSGEFVVSFCFLQQGTSLPQPYLGV